MSEPRPPQSDVDVLATVEGNATIDPNDPDHPGRGVDPTVSAERSPGDHIGRYLLVDRIGRGGMGVVYAAYDPELDRKIALKLVRADANSAASSERLIREAQAMARLNHRNVITVHDVGRLDDGAVFIGMEFVDGPTLADWQREPHREWSEILRVYLDAGRGVAAAHDARLVHRDFKPENVLIDPRGRAVVLDFGLARHDEARVAAALSGVFPRIEDLANLDRSALTEETISESLAEASRIVGHQRTGTHETGGGLTRTGALLGTPAYMAPEQHTGGHVDTRSDQFAYCVALWEALHGERPFAGESLAAIAFAVLQGEIREPSSDAGIPESVNAALRRGLSTAPSERYESMHALLADLQPDEPATPRRSWIALGVTTVGFAAALGVAIADEDPAPSCQNVDHQLTRVWNQQRIGELAGAFERTDTPFAADAWKAAHSGIEAWAQRWRTVRLDACQATRERGEQSAALMDLRMACLDARLGEVRSVLHRFADPDAATVERAAETVEQLPSIALCSDTEALTRTEPPPADPDVLRAVTSVREQLDSAEAAKAAGDKKLAVRLASDAFDVAERSGYAPSIAEAAIALGKHQTSSYDFKAAERALERAVLTAESTGDARVGATAWVALLAVRGSEQFEMEAAHTAARHAEAYLARFDALDPVRADYHENLAQVLEWEGKYPEAIAEAEKSLAIVTQNGGEVSLAASSIYTAIGNSHWELGKLDDALRYHRKAHDLDLAILGPAHPAIADALSNMGIIHDERGDYRKARELYEESIEIVTAAGNADDGDLGVFHNNVASTYLEEGNWTETAAHYDLALEHWQRAYGTKHPDVAMVTTNLALIDEHRGDLDGALQKYDRAIDIYTDHFGAKHREVAWTQAARADILRQLGRLDEARETLRDAIERSIAAVGPDHEDVAQARVHLGRVFLSSGQWSDAKGQFERAAEIRLGRYEPTHHSVVRAQGLAAVALLEDGATEAARPQLVEAMAGLADAASEDDTHALIEFAHARALLEHDPTAALAAARAAATFYTEAPRQFADDAARVNAWVTAHAAPPSP